MFEVAEPGVPLNIFICLEEWDGLPHVSHLSFSRKSLRVIRTRASDLGDPNGFAKDSIAVKMVLQAIGITSKDMNTNSVDLAALASCKELSEPLNRIHVLMVIHLG